MKTLGNLSYQQEKEYYEKHPDYIVLTDFTRKGGNKFRAVHVDSPEGKQIQFERKQAELQSSISAVEKAFDDLMLTEKETLTKAEIRQSLTKYEAGTTDEFQTLIEMLVEEEIKILIQ